MSSYHDLEDQLSHLSDDSDQEYQQEAVTKFYNDNNNHSGLNTNTQTATPSRDFIYPITTSGNNDEFIHIDNKKFLRSDLIKAFGGSLVPGYQSRPSYNFANPAPLGLSAFALTTFVLSLSNARARSVTTPNIVVGLALFYGGVVQLCAGMWEIALNNPFGGTALSSYGGFWLSFGAIYIKWFGIIDAYEDPAELENAVGFYLIGWAIFTFGLTLLTLKSTLAFFSLFFSLTITFLLLAIGKFATSVGVTQAGGVFGIITAFIAWYNAFAGLANRENSYFVARVVHLPEDVFHPKKTK